MALQGLFQGGNQGIAHRLQVLCRHGGEALVFLHEQKDKVVNEHQVVEVCHDKAKHVAKDAGVLGDHQVVVVEDRTKVWILLDQVQV
jgi:hypothetical protein